MKNQMICYSNQQTKQSLMKPYQIRNLKKYKIQLDKNYDIIISVCQKPFIVYFSGSIYHKNSFPLKLSPRLWKVINKFQTLQREGYLLQYNRQSSTLQIISKIVLQKQNIIQLDQQIDNRIINLTKSTKIFINKAYLYGIIQFNNKRSLKQSLEQAILKFSFNKQIFKHNIIKGQMVKQKKENENMSQMKRYNQFNEIMNVQPYQECQNVIKCYIQCIQPTKNQQILPKQLKYGDKSVVNNFLRKQSSSIKSGGFFNIQKIFCKISFNSYCLKNYYNNKRNNQSKFNINHYKVDQFQILAKKTLKQQRKTNQINNLKLQKQLSIIKNIEDTKYLLKYFEHDQNLVYKQNDNLCQNLKRLNLKGNFQINGEKFRKQVFMQFHKHTLTDFMNSRQFSFHQSLSLCQQLIESTLYLHQSYVIHRDLKPANILIDFSTDQNKSLIKVIDFSESAIYYEKNKSYEKNINSNLKKIIFESFNTKLYGATYPYSPFQCLMNKQSRQAIGINSFKIDSWSIGMILFQVHHQKSQINFSLPIIDDYLTNLSDYKFQTYGFRYNNRGINLFTTFINFLADSNLINNQQKRLSMSLMYKLNKIIQKSIKKWISLIKHNK